MRSAVGPDARASNETRACTRHFHLQRARHEWRRCLRTHTRGHIAALKDARRRIRTQAGAFERIRSAFERSKQAGASKGRLVHARRRSRHRHSTGIKDCARDTKDWCAGGCLIANAPSDEKLAPNNGRTGVRIKDSARTGGWVRLHAMQARTRASQRTHASELACASARAGTQMSTHARSAHRS